MQQQLEEVAQGAVADATRLGAEQVKAWVSTGVEVELQQRAGQLERVHEARSLSLSVSLMVDGRFSSHSTSDLRPAAVEAFLTKAVAGTRYLEPDPDRVMVDRDQMGSLDPESLDNHDPEGLVARSPTQRQDVVRALEDAITSRGGDDLVSTTAYLWEVGSDSVAAFSNGFTGRSSRTHFGLGGMLTLKEPSGKLPENYSFYNASHLGDVPSVDAVATDLWERADEVRETSAIGSEVLPMILDRRVASRLLGSIIGPLSGGNLHTGRSLFLDKLGDKLGSDAFTLTDDPTIPRGMGSKPFDGDGRIARVRPIFAEGVLQTYFLDVYHARKLGMDPTTGGTSNVVMAPGPRSWQDIAASVPRAIRVTSFLGGNSNPSSGDFSFGIRGQLFVNGQWSQNVSEMNVTGNLLQLMERFSEPANDVWTYSSYRVPSLVFQDVQFSGT
jgi:PmbA protein